MQSTRGYFAYRLRGIYYSKYLACGAQISEFGQKLANSIPRDPSIFQDWVRSIIRMLEEVRAKLEENLWPDGCIPMDYELIDGRYWTMDHHHRQIKWTYVIDLDNLMFTVNQVVHFRLDNMPPSNPGLGYYWTDLSKTPRECFPVTFHLWPNPLFDIEERQQSYNALNPVILPVREWGVPNCDKFTMAQRFSMALSNYFLRNISTEMHQAYTPKDRRRTGHFCWDLLCAATSGVPLLHYDEQPDERILASRAEGNSPYVLVEKTGAQEFKSFEPTDAGNYCWVRGCLVTFCVQLSQKGQVEHEILQMVHKMHLDEQAECVGIILSSQRELIVVAIDNGLGPTREVRHTPVLDIRPSTGRPGEASDGLLLLLQLLSPPATIPPLRLPWRAPWPNQPVPLMPQQLSVELVQHIIHYADTETYLTLCKVSKSIRKICLSNPRVGEYTILHKIPQGDLAFAARHTGDETLRILDLRWIRCPNFRSYGYWEAHEIPNPAEAVDVVDDEAKTKKKRLCW
ncbi:hypothetical protein RSOLAG22IIIB_06492 [Rhizoctonia solani]|uniref:F-box domain-containing protein n=1 Tax=Rhizoctonia solani TaxID=456999 RepID=A0A0K6GEN7_9AGAM|nr:hypothetical protein RSOLAG22IIIB_06492 [Rhizoctonia solani]